MAPIYLIPLLELNVFVLKKDCAHAYKVRRNLNAIQPLESLERWGFIEAKPEEDRRSFGGDEVTDHIVTKKGKVFLYAIGDVPDPILDWKVPAK